MILVLDNYDSFTWNLVQLLGGLETDPVVLRNDERSVDEVLEMRPERVVLSPGPCTPNEAGITVDLIRALDGQLPVLGVCLGHQSIAEAYGGRTIRAPRVMHGKVDPIEHTGEGLFEGLASPFDVTRYHSLVTDPEELPDALEPVAWSGAVEQGDRVIQAVRHRTAPVWGIQFHPESLFSSYGVELMRNFLRL
ncbi:MAG: aminodeoxychorismate/anthranilate synthase component II [Gemmatimonadales bacterium]|nr:MAG: aminodeoxychorismate/anthranilate synthase component II [Gemmatimonadales bacterium]